MIMLYIQLMCEGELEEWCGFCRELMKELDNKAEDATSITDSKPGAVSSAIVSPFLSLQNDLSRVTRRELLELELEISQRMPSPRRCYSP